MIHNVQKSPELRLFGLTVILVVILAGFLAPSGHAIGMVENFAAGETQMLLDKYLNPFVGFLSVIAGVVIVISIIVGGIQYSSAGSDPNKVSAAKKRITNALVSLVAFIFLVAFLQWIIPGGLL